ALIAAAVGFHDSVDTVALFPIFAIIITPAIITALTEPAILLPPICKPFVKRGLIGKLASYALLPGWPTGVFYTVILSAITLCGISISHNFHSSSSYRSPVDEKVIITTFACFTSVIFCALLSAHFSKSEDKRLTNFLIFFMLSIALTIIPNILLSINHSQSLLWIFAWNPPIWIAMMNESFFKTNFVLTTALTVSAIYLALLIISAMFALRRYREVMQETEDQLSQPAK
ncbi:MAG: hypothetical protein HC845_02200, partial [Akkermansiaceae bacterium]|nr:hypothetical protein [Akkermansiaceae bacterium]